MTDIKRFGVSLPAELLDEFDTMIEGMGYDNRSKAIADLIRDKMVEKSWDSDKGEVIGIVTMIYDHHTSDTVSKLIELQHSVHIDVYSTMHVHLDPDNCLEILALKSTSAEAREFANNIKSVRGVKHSGLVMTSNVK
jgi:CopG family nickel-responsive transcriptional regulator